MLGRRTWICVLPIIEVNRLNTLRKIRNGLLNSYFFFSFRNFKDLNLGSSAVATVETTDAVVTSSNDHLLLSSVDTVTLTLYRPHPKLKISRVTTKSRVKPSIIYLRFKRMFGDCSPHII